MVAEENRAPLDPDVKAPLRPKPLFAIKLKDGELVTECLTAWRAAHHHGNIEVRALVRGLCLVVNIEVRALVRVLVRATGERPVFSSQH